MRRRWQPRAIALLLEAALALGAAKATMTLLPFRLTSRLLGAAGSGAASVTGTPDRRARHIGWAVSTAAHRLPWDSTCLVQAAATAALSAVHGVNCTVWLGVNRSDGDFLAHAWVTSGTRVLVGAPGHGAFTPVGSFSRPGRRRA